MPPPNKPPHSPMTQQNPRPPQPPLHRHRAGLHLATTLSALLSLPSAWPNLKNASPSLSPNLQALAKLSSEHPDLTPYLTREMALRARNFMQGITAYRKHATRRGDESAPVIWQSGSTKLRDYAPKSLVAPVVLVVPSLVNRFTIMDVQPDHSFLRMLALHGFRPLVVDWDEPGEAEENFTAGDYVTQRLIPALQIAAAERPAHILGYCMGGLLALALATLVPTQARSLSLLATPWDFHAGFAATGQEGAALEEKLKVFLAGDAFLSAEVMQSVFTSFQPLHAFRKFSTLATQMEKGEDVSRFVLTEDWLNDGVNLSAPAARECFGDWCARNVTAANKWRVGGAVIDPRKLTLPAYVVVPGRDRIVPPESAMPLAHALSHAIRHEPMMGHIGIMAGSDAPERVWKPLVGWLGKH